MRISDWSSDVCSSDLRIGILAGLLKVDGTVDHGRRSPERAGFAQISDGGEIERGHAVAAIETRRSSVIAVIITQRQIAGIGVNEEIASSRIARRSRTGSADREGRATSTADRAIGDRKSDV